MYNTQVPIFFITKVNRRKITLSNCCTLLNVYSEFWTYLFANWDQILGPGLGPGATLSLTCALTSWRCLVLGAAGEVMSASGLSKWGNCGLAS